MAKPHVAIPRKTCVRIPVQNHLSRDIREAHRWHVSLTLRVRGGSPHAPREGYLVRQRTIREIDVGQAFQPDRIAQLTVNGANPVRLESLTYEGALAN